MTRRPAGAQGTQFEYVRALLLQRIAERKKYHERRQHASGPRFWIRLLRSKRPNLGDIIDQWWELKEQQKSDDSELLGTRNSVADLRYLFATGALHELLWYLLIGLAVGLTLSEWSWWSSVVGIRFPNFMSSAFTKWGVIGSLSDHLPGRLVAVSTAFIGIAYYRHIFVGLTSRRLGTRLGRAADVAMRTNILFALLLQFYAVLLPGRWLWAVLGGAGGVFVAANNSLCRRLVNKAATRANDPLVNREAPRAGAAHYSTLGQKFTEFCKKFRPWPLLMLLYSGGGVIIGFLLWRHLAHDRWVLAVIMIGVNYLKLYRWNILTDGPSVRAGLARSVFLLQRRPPAQGRRVHADAFEVDTTAVIV